MNRTRVLILGGGFAGVYCARELASFANRIETTLVSEENFFLFTPLLHEVASAAIGLTDVVCPLRQVLPGTCHFFQGKISQIDLNAKQVTITYGESPDNNRVIEYDHLVVAFGSECGFHGVPGVEEHAQRMKTLGDAIELRNKLIGSLEKAQVETDEAIARRRLTFVVSGGGFAGVETVGAINDFLRAARESYDKIRSEHIRVILVHAEEQLLPELTDELGTYTAEQLRQRGVELKLKTRVTNFDGETVKLDDGTELEADTLVWTAGTQPVKLDFHTKLPLEKGRFVADEFLRLRGEEAVWVAGDCAQIEDTATGKSCPPTAQHALREGRHIARNIIKSTFKRKLRKFSYETKGQMASIGAHTAVAVVFGKTVVGFPAWLLWRLFYWNQLPAGSQRARVLFNWLLDLAFPPELVRLDTPRLGLKAEVEPITKKGVDVAA